MIEKKYKVIAESGMHARPATIIVTEADRFECDITLKYHDKNIDFKSIIGVLSLGIYMGETVTLIYKGIDEDGASKRIGELLISLGIAKEV